MRFQVLGPLQVRGAQGDLLELGSPKHRTLLSLLLLDAGRVVSVDRIVEALWSGEPPASATATLQTYVSQLRRMLEPERGPRQQATVLVTRSPGYLLVADATTLDALRLQQLVAHGSRLVEDGDLVAAQDVLEEATALWREEPYPDLGGHPRVVAERTRLHQLWLTAQELLAFVRVRLGRAGVAVADLEALVSEHPLRERLWARLIEALYAGGRQAEALAAYKRCATLLSEELGLDPGAELVALETAVLRHELDLPMVVASPERVAAPTQVPRPVRASEESRMIGRAGERELVRAALARTTRGNGAVLVLEGEPGIGKTRLAEEATLLAEAQGWRSAWTRCADDAGAPALWPWSQLLTQLDLDPPTLPAGDDADRGRFELFQVLRAGLQQVAGRSPLLVVLDDIQAADASSLQLLTLLARHLDSLRMLVVVTVRTIGEELTVAAQECLAALAREPRAQRVQLSGLVRDEVRELLEETLGSGTDELARQIHARTQGNPFFVGELARLLRAEQRDGDAPALPPSVRDVLERRLDVLPAATLTMLRAAAVAGQEYDLLLLQRTTGQSVGDVVAAIEPAVRAGVVREQEPGWEWRFSHGLVQETLLAGLSRLESARLHQAVAAALESRGDATDLERLAHHYAIAVPVAGVEPAIRYAVLAADAARARLAHPEAADHTRRALRLLDASAEAGDRERHRLLAELSTDLLRSGEPQQAQVAVAQALDVARRLGDRDLMAEAASVWGGVTLWNWRGYGVVDHDLVRLLEDLAEQAGERDPALRARLLGTLGVELAYSPRREDGIRYAETAVEIARGLGDVALLGRTLNNYSLVTWGSVSGVEQRLAAADESLALVGLPARTEFFAYLHRGPLRLHLGDLDGFEADLAAATRIAAGLSGPEVRPHVLHQQASRAMLHGQWQEAEALAAEARDLYLRTDMPGGALSWAIQLYTCRSRVGRAGEAVEALLPLADDGVPLTQALAVLATAEAGDLDEARRLDRRWPRQTPQDWTTDVLVVVRAKLALALGGDLDAAYRNLLPFAGRQAIFGSATACWGSYSTVLADLAAARGDQDASLRHAQDALVEAHRVRSPWQVRDAEARLNRPLTAH